MQFKIYPKAFLYLIILLSVSSNSLFSQSKNYDIEDLFLTVPNKIIDEGMKIGYDTELTRSEMLEFCTTKKDFYQLVIDKKNYYMQIRIEGGTGDYFRTYALYFLTDNTPIMAISMIDGSSSMTPSRFYLLKKISDEKWIDVTKEMAPIITKRDFLRDNNKPFNQSDNDNIKYYLPRYGTTIVVKYEYDDYSETYEESKKGQEELNKELKYQELKLKWVKKEGVFKILSK